MDNYFSVNVKFIRKSKGLTQGDIAKIAELKQATAVSAWENEVSLPSASVLLKLSSYFKVTIDDLLKKDLAKEGETPPNNQTSMMSKSSYEILLEDAIKKECPKLAKRLNL